jgi:hypothetical protein
VPAGNAATRHSRPRPGFVCRWAYDHVAGKVYALQKTKGMPPDLAKMAKEAMQSTQLHLADEEASEAEFDRRFGCAGTNANPAAAAAEDLEDGLPLLVEPAAAQLAAMLARKATRLREDVVSPLVEMLVKKAGPLAAATGDIGAHRKRKSVGDAALEATAATAPPRATALRLVRAVESAPEVRFDI